MWMVVATGLAFDFTNGFHDTANSVATSISTRAMGPRVAVTVAAALAYAGLAALAFVGFARGVAWGVQIMLAKS